MNINKAILILISILVVFFAIFIGIGIYGSFQQENKEGIKENIVLSEKITDECTEEWEQMEQEENTISTSGVEDVKISPNCSLTLKRHFTGCDHITNEYLNMPQEYVNMTQDEFIKNYEGWYVEKFVSNEVILSKDMSGECGEHFVIRDENGFLNVYRVVDGVEEEYETTEISVEYLPETDKINFRDGLKVYGKENLSQILEDFE